MKTISLVKAVAVIVAGSMCGCTSAVEVCTTYLQATQANLARCPDAGLFVERSPGFVSSQCAAADKSCPLADGGTGSIDLVLTAKCAESLKTTSCDATQTWQDGCRELCR